MLSTLVMLPKLSGLYIYTVYPSWIKEQVVEVSMKNVGILIEENH